MGKITKRMQRALDAIRKRAAKRRGGTCPVHVGRPFSVSAVNAYGVQMPEALWQQLVRSGLVEHFIPDGASYYEVRPIATATIDQVRDQLQAELSTFTDEEVIDGRTIAVEIGGFTYAVDTWEVGEAPEDRVLHSIQFIESATLSQLEQS